MLCLGAYSKKHVFCPSALSVKLARERLEDFGRRVHWAVALKNEQSRSSRPLKARRIRECREWLPAVVRSFTAAVRNGVLSEIRKVSCRCCRVPGFVRFTTRWLRTNKIRAALSDKDGVFALCRHDIMNSMVRRELAKPCYRPYSPLSLEADIACVPKLQYGCLSLDPCLQLASHH